jgi:hypothetical protein
MVHPVMPLVNLGSGEGAQGPNGARHANVVGPVRVGSPALGKAIVARAAMSLSTISCNDLRETFSTRGIFSDEFGQLSRQAFGKIDHLSGD